ncbi:MAG: DUF4097 family beta strand repeat-containing protein [Pyrinomonadaceae bacterium]
MNEHCKNCGAELFAGQQFCRQCGAPTRPLSGEETPTQILPHGEAPHPPQGPSGGGAAYAGGTTPLPGRGTDPGFQHYAGYQSPLAGAYNATPAAVPPSKRPKRMRFWIFAALFFIVFSAGASILVAYIISESTRRTGVRRVVIKRPEVPPVPPVRVEVPEIAIPELPAIAGDTAETSVLNETGAEVSDDETVITKTFPLAAGAAFSIQNFSGSVTIEGWDSAEAEVKIVKRGGTPEGRERAKIGHTHTDKRLSFSTSIGAQANLEEVAYEVKLPRAALGEIQIKALNSEVSLKGVRAGQVSIGVQHGDVELQDVGGEVTSKTVQGDTTITFESANGPGGPQSFSSVNGDVTLRLSPETNADLKAETISGDIEAAEELGVKVEKRRVGQRAAGTAGAGGQPIAIKTISGDIRIER